VDLADKREAYVNTLSRGMTQRLCLAHTLVHDPQVLLLDEPASGLDPRARVEMRELLRELSAMGKTIVLSSHILTELAELCDTVGIMERGKLVVSGSLDEIHRRAADHRMLRLQVLSEWSAAEPLLAAHPGVRNVFVRERTNGNGSNAGSQPVEVEIEFRGDASAAADLLETLVLNRVRVASFTEAASDLEEAFLRLTKGEVA